MFGQASAEQSKSIGHQLIISEQRMTFAASMQLKGTRLLTLKEFIMELKNNPTFFKNVNGHWYWLADSAGLDISQFCKIDYENGSIMPITKKEWDTLPVADRAFAWSGTGPLSIYVGYHWGRRLDVGCYGKSPDETSSGTVLLRDENRSGTIVLGALRQAEA